MAFQALEVTASDRPEATIVHLKGDVTADAVDRMRRGIAEALSRKPRRLVIDLSQTSFLSSPGLAAMVQALQLSQRAGTSLVLAGANERVRGLFEISRLTDIFRMVPSIDDAVAA
jgi:anti-sigma B factor antagonist